MAVVHINIQTDVVLGKFNHHYFGWVEDAQGFVFISGFVVGLVYGGKLLRRGFKDMRQAVYQRAVTIYSHQSGLILIMLCAALLFAWFDFYPVFLTPYVESPFGFSLASLMLIANSAHMGILPMYIWYMMLTPFVLMAIHRGWIAPLILLCVLSWTFAQTGLLELATDDVNGILQSYGVTINLGRVDV